MCGVRNSKVGAVFKGNTGVCEKMNVDDLWADVVQMLMLDC